ncbi:T9SS type A sorting domain-containing protein [bacterium]|nr:T9SS type A sorting domain-containing protein [bacterium]
MIKKILLASLLILLAFSAAHPCRVLFHLRSYGLSPEFGYTSAMRDSLRSWGCDVVDTLWDYFEPDSFDIICFLGHSYRSEFPFEDSLIEAMQEFVYNGGILIIVIENWGSPNMDLLWNPVLTHPGWNLGLTVNMDRVFDPPYNMPGWTEGTPRIFNLLYHPITAEIDTLILLWTGSINITPTDRALAWTSPTGYSADNYGDTVIASEPVVIAMSYFGRGIVIIHGDWSFFTRWEYPYYDDMIDPYDNDEFTHNIFNCNLYPEFIIYPPEFTEVPCPGDLDSIQIYIERYGQIYPYLTVLRTDGTDYSYPDLSGWEPGESLQVCIMHVEDGAGFWPFDSICWWYLLSPEADITPPVITSLCGDSVSFSDTVAFIIIDSSGVDWASVSATLGGDSLPYTVSGNTLFTFGFPDTTFSPELCLHVPDLSECGPNITDTCFIIHIESSYIAEAPIPRDFSLAVYPNPFNSLLNIKLPAGDYDIEILDIQGKRVAGFIGNAPLHTVIHWDASEMASGIYFVFEGQAKVVEKVILLR